MSWSALVDALAVILTNRILQLLLDFHYLLFKIFVGFFEVDGARSWHTRLLDTRALSQPTSLIRRSFAQFEIKSFLAVGRFHV